MTNNDIMQNQAQVFNHLKLESDLAYIWSVENNNIENMQMVLRAYGEDFSCELAELQIKVGQQLAQ